MILEENIQIYMICLCMVIQMNMERRGYNSIFSCLFWFSLEKNLPLHLFCLFFVLFCLLRSRLMYPLEQVQACCAKKYIFKEFTLPQIMKEHHRKSGNQKPRISSEAYRVIPILLPLSHTRSSRR